MKTRRVLQAIITVTALAPMACSRPEEKKPGAAEQDLEDNAMGRVRMRQLTRFKHERMRYPKSVRFGPKGDKVYVQNLFSGDRPGNTMVFDAKRLELTETIDHPNGRPVELLFTKGGRWMWSSYLARVGGSFPPYHREGTPEGEAYDEPSVVAVYDRATKKFVHRIPVGVRPKIMARSPDGKLIFVSNYQSDTISVIDTEKYAVIKTLAVDGRPRGIVFTPDGKRAYVAPMHKKALAEIDVDKLEVVGRLDVGSGPRHLEITRDGRWLYVGLNSGGSIVKVDLSKRKVVSRLKLGRLLRTMALSSNQRRLAVVVYGDNEVALVDARDMTELGRAKTEKKPVGCDLSPDGRRLWVTNYHSHSVQVFDVPH